MSYLVSWYLRAVRTIRREEGQTTAE